MTAKTITLSPPMEGTGKTTSRAARDAQQSILLDFLARGCRALEAVEREGQARRMPAHSWVFPETFRKGKSISSAPWRAPEPRGLRMSMVTQSRRRAASQGVARI